MPGGSLIAHFRDKSGGTLGCLVRKPAEPSVWYILSASHVLAWNGFGSVGDAIVLYSKATSASRRIARLTDYVRFTGGVGGTHTLDAAYARVDARELVSPRIEGIGLPRGITNPYKRMSVQLCGAASGQVAGRIESYGESADVTYYTPDRTATFSLRFENQIRYGTLDSSGRSIQPITKGGDSGALVLDAQGYAVGLHIASSADGRASICTPLTEILKFFQLELVTADSDPAAPFSAVANVGHAAAPAAPATSSSLEENLDSIGERGLNLLGRPIRGLFEPQTFGPSIAWHMSLDGLVVAGEIPRTAGRLVTVPRVWKDYAGLITNAADEFKVPAELIVATICTESSGHPREFRREPLRPGETEADRRVSAGLMQTLVSTAAWILDDPSITAEALFNPATSITAGTRYIAYQSKETGLDPPRVACAYNAGSLKLNTGEANRWKMRQYPIGTGQHADRFVAWFNDCFEFFRRDTAAPRTSFAKLIHG